MDVSLLFSSRIKNKFFVFLEWTSWYIK
jgi:hypothetical protein